ncbi:hypothetical protein QYM36_013971, partial [Artemia franciscana]
ERRIAIMGFVFKIVTLLLFILMAVKIIYNLYIFAISTDESHLMVEDELGLNLNSRKITVEVYYEALCPDSKHFINRQLKPTNSKIGPYINISYVPYGKAKTRANDTSWSFDCQHGELECQGNIVHACGIKYIDDPLSRLNFVSCLITNGWKPEEYGEK